MQKTYVHAFVANCLKLDLRAFHQESFCIKKFATWKVFVFSAPVMFHSHLPAHGKLPIGSYSLQAGYGLNLRATLRHSVRVRHSKFIIRLLLKVLVFIVGRWCKDDLSCKWWRCTADSTIVQSREKLVTDLPNAPCLLLLLLLCLSFSHHCLDWQSQRRLSHQIAACSDFINN